jgi:uncharacterized protein YoxC
MKAAAVLSFATAALGAVVVRDAATVQKVIETAGSDIDALTEAVTAYSGDKAPLVEAADQLVSNLQAGKETVAGSGSLGITDAALLAEPVNTLAAKGSDLTDALKAKKSVVEETGECATVQEQIDSIYTASNDLIDTVIGLVEEVAKPVAQELASKLTTVLEDAKSSFADCGGEDGGDDGDDGDNTATPTGGATTMPPKPTDSGKPTGGVTTDCPPTATGTGGQPQPTTEQPPMVTGAAAAFAPAGILAAVAAAFAL